MKLIVGLGNPEDKYAGTRHNLGFELIDKYIAHTLPVNESDKFWSPDKKFKSEIGKIGDLILAKPQTYMNHSGLAVKSIADYYKISSEDIIIIHDDLDLPLGHLKIRLGGSAAGHHGVESIIESLGTDKFIRLRLGIGNLKTRSGEHKQISFSAERFVLQPFAQKEHSAVKRMIKRSLLAVNCLLIDGLEATQNQFN